MSLSKVRAMALFITVLAVRGTVNLLGQTLSVSEWSLHQDSSIISEVRESTLTSNIDALQRFGTRYWNNGNRDSVFSWVQHSFQYAGTWQKNIIATLNGVLHPEADIIIGGHIDSYSSDLLRAPGADDNASGTAAVLEMARVILSQNYKPSVTIRFIGFAAEEAGLNGSADYAVKARQDNRDIKRGHYEITWHADNNASGTYFYQLRTPEFIATKKLVLAR